MYFSPAYLSSLIVEPLRYMFGAYAPVELTWNQDPKLSNIEIDTINNFNKIAIQSKPRILVSRGGYNMSSSGLTDSMYSSNTSRAIGPSKTKKMFYVNGSSQILVESVNEGTCEKIVELVANFITRTAPLICDVQGFNQFGIPLSVSPCTPGKENTDIFSCTISFNWNKETAHMTTIDGVDLKKIVTSVFQAVV